MPRQSRIVETYPKIPRKHFHPTSPPDVPLKLNRHPCYDTFGVQEQREKRAENHFAWQLFLHFLWLRLKRETNDEGFIAEGKMINFHFP